MSGNRENLTLSSSPYWNWVCECVGGRTFAARWMWLLEELVVASVGAASSFVSGWIIWAMTGFFFRPMPSWLPPGRYTRSLAAKR